MARGKKKEAALTPEERLQAALVPDWEQPYKVPENWCWTYLTKGAAECLDAFRKPINATERSGREGDIPYYGATGQVGWINNFLTDEQLVLVGEDGAPFLDLIKDKAYLIEGKAWVNNHAHILRSRFGSIGNHFLMHYLNVFNYHGYVNGTTRLKLTQGSMDTIPVPLPPLPEQHRIVTRIESLFAKLNEAKEKAQAVVDGFETRRAAILHRAFTGELTAGWRKEHGLTIESWDNKTLGEIASFHQGVQVALDEQFEDFSENRVRFIRIIDYTQGMETKRYVSNDKIRKDSYVKGDEIVMVRYGATAGFIGEGIEGLIANNMFVVNVKKSIRDYVKAFLKSPITYSKLNSSGGSTAMPALNFKTVSAIQIPLPTEKEQAEIVRVLDSLLAKEQRAKEAAEAVLERIELIKKAILARAFRGELGTNEPGEESAVEMLKKTLLCDTDESPASTAAQKRITIPKKISEKLSTGMERDIVKLLYKADKDDVPLSEIMSLSSKKFDLLDTIRALENKNIIRKNEKGDYVLVN